MTAWCGGNDKRCCPNYWSACVSFCRLQTRFSTWTQPSKWQKRGDQISRAGKIKGSKITLLTDERSFVVSVDIRPAGQHDTRACQSVLYSIPKQVTVTADKGYDDQKLRKWLRKRKIKPVIPKRQMSKKIRRRTPSPLIYKGRWVVERGIAWLEKYRKLVVRYERYSDVYECFWYLGSAMIILNHLTG